MVFNVLGLPSTNIPLGFNKEGMPIGIQVSSLLLLYQRLSLKCLQLKTGEFYQINNISQLNHTKNIFEYTLPFSIECM